jgi:light-regulated signal transduction histidine kinase (bacteriophytochrome)
LLVPLEGDKNPLLVFILATFIAARYGGLWQGILTGAGGLLVADYCFVTPQWTFFPLDKLHWNAALAYVGITGTAITLLEALQKANRRAGMAMEAAKEAEARVVHLNAELERRVCERTTALEEANRELESFSYSVSHDLRAPLRSISGFSTAVLEDYRDKLDENAVKFLQLAVDASRRMGGLIDDLMTLSMVTRTELRREQVDVSQLAAGAVARLQEQDPQRTVEVSIAPDLRASADAGLLRIALENLLGNAWKFTNRTPKPRIEIGSSSRNGSVTFFVRDNGAGFDMARARNRLFGAFQRFHADRDFPGTGVGLATVRRIVSRHGGQVWAEAKINEGAAFYFSLPPENGA